MKTNFDTILACLGVKVCWWWGSNFFVTEMSGGCNFFYTYFLNLGPSEEENASPDLKNAADENWNASFGLGFTISVIVLTKDELLYNFLKPMSVMQCHVLKSNLHALHAFRTAMCKYVSIDVKPYQI